VTDARPQRSLAARLFAAVFALGATTVVLTATVSYRAAERALRERVLEQLETSAADDAVRLREWLDRQRVTVELLSQSVALDRYDRALAALPAPVLAAEELQLLSVPGGRIVRASDAASIGQYAVDAVYYREGQRGTFTQPIYPGGPEGRPRLTIATPVIGSDREVSAVLAVHLDLAYMEQALVRVPGALPVDAYLVDRFAEFVSATRFGREGVRRGVNSVAVRSALAGNSGTALYTDYAGRAVIGAWRWIPELELAVLRESPQAAAFAPARSLLLQTLAIGLVATALLALGVAAITRRFTEPVLAVADAAQAVAGGDFAVMAPEGRDDEVGQLAHAFNVMTSRLRTLYTELETQVSATGAALTEADSSRELLQDLVDNTTTLILVLDLAGHVRLANAHMARLVGVSASDLLGTSARDRVDAPTSALLAVLERARAEATVVEQEVELPFAEETRTWQVVAFPLVHRDGRTYATGLIATDLTERERAEAERRARDASVQQAQKLESLGIMAGGIAHDFNNLLGAMLGHAELARETLGDARVPLSPDSMHDVGASLDQITAAGRRAAELTRQMLAYAGRASLRREVVDARTLITDILPLVRAAQSKKVEFVLEPMPAPLWVEIDPAQLSQVLLNLLTNAAESIGDANGTVTVRATTGGHLDGAPGECVQFSVADTGTGIADETLARIFDPFFSTKGSGRGLGLSAVRGIVHSLGGVLSVQSTPLFGTRFDIALPAAAAPSPTAVETEPLPDHALRATVLVIDDEHLMRVIARRVLEGMGLTVLEAEDGAQGIAMFAARTHEVSLVLLDLTMPRLGGEEVLERIRITHPALPVVIASGYDHTDALARIPEDRHTRFLQKPFSVQALRDAVTRGLTPAVRP
jgi:two-component system, cell cycle sensor histidine kinase and response regulator CckA